jgi:hypothetical protein
VILGVANEGSHVGSPNPTPPANHPLCGTVGEKIAATIAAAWLPLSSRGAGMGCFGNGGATMRMLRRRFRAVDSSTGDLP